MDFQLFDMIPVAAICFKKTTNFDHNPEIEICHCNKAFTDLFKADLSGMVSQDVSDRFRGLISELIEKAKTNKKKFSLFFENHNFSMDVDYCGEYCLACIDTSLDILKRVLNIANNGIVITDSNCNITYFNDTAKNIASLCEKDIGKKFTDIFSMTTNVKDNIVCDLNSNDNKNLSVMKSDGSCTAISINQIKDESSDKLIYILKDQTKLINLKNELEFYKSHDLLTGLYNRTTFEKLVSEINNESHYPISIIIGDINGLHMVNEILGKRRGDSVLVTVANIFTLACRDTDIIARYGGDTFIVALPNTTLETTQKICKNILSLCSTENSKISKISVSLGYSCMDNTDKSFDEALETAEDFMMRHKMLEVKSYHSSFLDSLKRMLYTKSYETEKHALRITSLCQKMGQAMGLSDNDLNDLGLFSMLHDIGKIGIKDQVLMKPGKLTDNEWVEMKKHSVLGYRIAKTAPELQSIANDILYHHERFDGNGYPEGLKGDEIPLLSRILAVADSYDAMVNDRCYRKALPKETAIAEIKRCSGTQFDPKVVNCFLKIMDNSEPLDKKVV